MKPHSDRTLWRRRSSAGSRWFGGALALCALVASQACGSSGKCEDTDTCGTFAPNPGCGWIIDNHTVAYTVDEMLAHDASWTEANGWTLSNGHRAELRCGLTLSDGGMVGTSGTSGTLLDSSTGGTATGGSSTGGTHAGGTGGVANMGGSHTGGGGTGGVNSNDAGTQCANCVAPNEQCSPAGDCVECTDSSHCSSETAPRCNTTAFTCGDCTGPTDCATFPATPNCDTGSGACVGCTDNTQCTNADNSLCGPGSTCEPCAIDDDCMHLPQTPVCDNGTCVQCTGTNYDSCGMLNGTPIVCDSTQKICAESINANKEHAADVCQPCISDAHCAVGQLCVMEQYNTENVGYFCFWEQGAGGAAPSDCFATGRPFVDVLDQQVSIDNTTATICGLRSTTCVSYNQYSTIDCAQGASPDDAVCGFLGGDDGYCRLVSGNNYRCTMSCLSSNDCDPGSSCGSTPKVCGF